MALCAFSILIAPHSMRFDATAA